MVPPDVILSISPRLAKLVRHRIADPITDVALDDLSGFDLSGFSDEAQAALDALVAEIDSQLSRTPEKGTEPVTVTPIDSDSPAVAVRGQQAAEIAAKMARSARDAAEGTTEAAPGVTVHEVTDEELAEASPEYAEHLKNKPKKEGS